MKRCIRIPCGNGRARLLRATTVRTFLFCLLLMALALSACSDDEDDNNAGVDQNPAAEPGIDLERIDRIDDLVALIRSPEANELVGHAFEVEAWISPPPRTSGVPTTPPQGCPIVPEKQDWLSDDPIQTQIEVAGATIPNNRLQREVPLLRLVVPYQLGFVDIPERARMRGYVLDNQHSGCPSFESLFVLEEVLEALPADQDENVDQIVSSWNEWSHEDSGLTLEYPDGWDIEERVTGVSARVRFVGPEGFRSIRLEVQAGETYWHPDANSGSAQPEILLGDRQEIAMVGPARARLIDDSRMTGSGERELRLVFNHREMTISLAMIVRDGASLEENAIAVFSEMAGRVQLQGDITMSDPMDPILAASDEIGEGPFLSEADARYVAVNASGMSAAESIDAQLVSERDARKATDGACRDFEGSPGGVWLVTVDGTLPSGRETFRLVYLDAATGNRLCQAEASEVS